MEGKIAKYGLRSFFALDRNLSFFVARSRRRSCCPKNDERAARSFSLELARLRPDLEEDDTLAQTPHNSASLTRKTTFFSVYPSLSLFLEFMHFNFNSNVTVNFILRCVASSFTKSTCAQRKKLKVIELMSFGNPGSQCSAVSYHFQRTIFDIIAGQ
jgi:hypothetical protein